MPTAEEIEEEARRRRELEQASGDELAGFVGGVADEAIAEARGAEAPDTLAEDVLDEPPPQFAAPAAPPRAGLASPPDVGAPIRPALTDTPVESGLDYGAAPEAVPAAPTPREGPSRIPYRRNKLRDVLRGVSGVAQAFDTRKPADFSTFEKLDAAQEARRQARQTRADRIYESAQKREDVGTARKRAALKERAGKAEKLAALKEGREYAEGRADVKLGQQEDRDARQNLAAMERAQVMAGTRQSQQVMMAQYNDELARERQREQLERQEAKGIRKEHRKANRELENLDQLEAELNALPAGTKLPKDAGAVDRLWTETKAWVAGGSGMGAEDTALDNRLTGMGLTTYITEAGNAPNTLPEQKVAARRYRGDGTKEGALMQVRRRREQILKQRQRDVGAQSGGGQAVDLGDYE